MKKKEPKVKELDDGALIAHVLRKHRETYREIVRRYQKKLFAYLYRLVRNKEEAEDILQNVFFKVYRNLDRYDPQKKFSSWIYRIAHNEAVNFLKRKGRKQFVYWEDFENENKAEARSEERSPFEIWIAKESDREVRRAISSLPPKYAKVIRMRYFEEKSYSQIARIIRRPVNTVGTLINRAKKKLLPTILKKNG